MPDVAGVGQGADAERVRLFGHGIAVFRLAAGDHDVGAGLGEGEHHGASQAAAAASDQRDLAAELE